MRHDVPMSVRAASVEPTDERRAEIEDSPARLSPLIAGTACLGLCVVGPMLVVLSMPDPQPTGSAALLAVLVLVLAGARFSWLLGRGEARLMEFSFWIFTYVFMGLAPLVQMRSGIYPGTTPGLLSRLNFSASFIVLIGAIFAGIGCLVSRSSRERLAFSSVRRFRIVVLALAALVANVYYVAQVGPASLVSSRSDLNKAEIDQWSNSTTAAIVGSFCTMPLLVAWLGLVQLRHQRREAGQTSSLVLPAIVLCALLFSVNPISSPRYIFGTVILSILAGIGAYATATRVRIMSVAFLVALVFVFPVADAFRRSHIPDFSDLGLINSMTSGDFDAFGQVNNTVHYVMSEGITWGRQAAGVLLFWIPRSYWPDKPVDTGEFLAEYRGYTFENLSAPIWSELFINGGWIVLVLGMLALGVFMRLRDDRAITAKLLGQQPPVLSVILPFYMFILLRGSLLQAMAHLVVIASCAVFITRRNSRPSSARRSHLNRAQLSSIE
jgi:hypothetical protein